jgi:hypothetical protein
MSSDLAGADDESPAPLESSAATDPVAKRPSLAPACFVALALIAVPFYLWLGRKQWFSFDEWDFIAARNAGHINDLLRPHTDEHWSTLPILAWRGIWQVAGLSYLPYETLTVLLHVTIAALLRTVMRRAGVRPWTSTVAATSFLFFGAGAYNIIYAFQANFDGAVAFGLTHLLLADHDGPLDKRDWLGAFAGLCALMCSAPGVTMVAIVGIATLMRRGLKPAAFHTLPLAAIFAAWWLHYARSSTSVDGSVSDSAHFILDGVRATFGALAEIPAGGWLLAASLVLGAILLFAKGAGTERVRADLAAPVALLAGAPLLFVITSLGRAGFVPPNAGRYLHLAAAFVLPSIAVAVDALVERWRAVGSVAVALLVVGVPGNIGKAVDFAHEAKTWAVAKETILSIGRMPRAHQVPAGLRPDPLNAPEVTMGWILRGDASGRIRTRDAGAALLATNRLRLSLLALDRPVGRPCVPLTAPIVRHLAAGEAIGIQGTVVVTQLSAERAQTAPVAYGRSLVNPSLDHTIVSLAELTLRIAPALYMFQRGGGPRPSVC